MKDTRLKSWGFESFPTSDPRIIKYMGIENAENKMTSYELIPGVFVLYISLDKKYEAKNSASRGSLGYRIGYCYEGNYFTYIKDSKVLITTNELFIGRFIPESKFSFTTSHRTRAFNIIILDKVLDKNSKLFPYIGKFLYNFKNIKNMGYVMREKSLINLANNLILALKNEDFLLIKLLTLELIYRIGKIGMNPNKMNYFKINHTELVNEIEIYMRENLDNDISLEEISKKFKISKSSLNDKFSKTFQYTPMKYIQRLRLIKAQELLLKSNLSIIEISNDLNFKNPSNFTRAFKDFTGLSPSSYRKTNQ